MHDESVEFGNSEVGENLGTALGLARRNGYSWKAIEELIEACKLVERLIAAVETMAEEASE